MEDKINDSLNDDKLNVSKENNFVIDTSALDEFDKMKGVDNLDYKREHMPLLKKKSFKIAALMAIFSYISIVLVVPLSLTVLKGPEFLTVRIFLYVLFPVLLIILFIVLLFKLTDG